MNTIWKYELKIADIQEVSMPFLAEILTVQMQGDYLCLWAMVDPKQDYKTERTIEIFGTGNPMFPEEGEDISRHYIGTVQSHNGILVWHVFEQVNR